MAAIIDRYKQIQTNLAKKKEQKQSLQLSEEQARLATEKFGADKVNSALNTVQNAGVELTKAPEVAPIVNNEPTTPEITPQAPITPAPVETPVVEPVKQPVAEQVAKDVKATTPLTPSSVAGGKETPTPVVPKGFEYGSMIDPKTGQPQLVSTAELKRQKELKKNASIYTSGQALYDGIKSGSILPGTDQFSDLQQANPQVFAEYEALKKQEEAKNKINNVGKIIMGEPVTRPESSTLQDLLDKVSSGLDEDIMTQYKNMVTNNEEYVNANKKVTDLSTELAKVENDMNLIGEDMRKKITGETPESVIASKIAREAKPLLDKATYLQNQLEIAQADANRIMADNKGMFEIQMADRADKRNLAFQLYGTINAAEIRAEDIARADEELRVKMEQAKTEQEYLQYKDERDYNFKVAEALAKQEESARDYQLKEYEATKQKASDFLKQETVNEDGSTSTTWFNPITNQTISPQETFGAETPEVDLNKVFSGYSPKGQELLSVPDGTVIPTRLGEVSPQNAGIRGKECAEYVNDIAGTKMGSTYASKLAVCDEKTGGVGSVVAWKPNGSGEFGHTGIVVGEDNKNWYVKSSNYVPGTVTTEKIPKTSINNFYTPESVKQAQTPIEPQAKQYANGNVRTTEGILYDKKEVSAENQKLLSSESYKALKAGESFSREWNAYKTLIDKYGIEVMPGKARSEMQSAYERVMRQAQTFFNLGVLQKLDEEAVQRMIPKTARGLTDNKYLNPFERGGIAGQVKQVEEMIKSKIQGEYDSLNTVYGKFGDTLSGLSDVKRIYTNQVGGNSSELDEVYN